MHFRLPQRLDGFEASALAGNVVSQQVLAGASGAADLGSLQTHPRQSRSRSQAGHELRTVWSQESCAEAYKMLCTVSNSGWPNASLLQVMAQYLSAVSTSLIKQADPRLAEDRGMPVSDRMPQEAALGLSIFFTCQMLHHTEVQCHHRMCCCLC